MTQTSVVATRSTAFPGLLGDASFKLVDTKVSSEASAEIRFGVMIQHDSTDPQKAKLLTAITNVLAGIVVHNHGYAKDDELGSTGLKPKVTLDLLQKGRIWVYVEGAVTVDLAGVHVRAIANGGNTNLGAFLTAADGVNTIDISKFARWVRPSQSYGSDTVACVEVDLTNRKA